MTDEFTAMQSGFSRVYIIEGRARPDHLPSYESCLRAQGISKNFGDVTDIECPDPHTPGRFRVIGQIQAGDERATVTLEGRYALELRSMLLRLASERCPVDVQLHSGDCEDLSDFNDFKKAIVLEDALLMNWETEDIGVLTEDDQAAVNETAEISAKILYEVARLVFAEQGQDIVTNEVVDIIICDQRACGGGCTDDESDGCQRAYGVTLTAGGSPGTPADVVFTIDGGLTWYGHDIEDWASHNPSAVACVGSFLVVISNDADAHVYALKSEFDTYTDPEFTEVTTGYVAAGSPNDIFAVGSRAFVVGDGGYIYVSDDVTAGVTAKHTGTLTTSPLRAVDALDRDYAVAVGDNGVVLFTVDGGETWELATFPVGHGVTLNTVLMKNRREWFVGASDGYFYYTLDQGVRWTQGSFPQDGSGEVEDIVQATDSLFYLSHTTSGTRARILESLDGGYSWFALPQDSRILPLADRINRLAACEFDTGLLLAGGLGDDGSDGIIIRGDA